MFQPVESGAIATLWPLPENRCFFKLIIIIADQFTELAQMLRMKEHLDCKIFDQASLEQCVFSYKLTKIILVGNEKQSTSKIISNFMSAARDYYCIQLYIPFSHQLACKTI